jgi:hypothetical protein
MQTPPDPLPFFIQAVAFADDKHSNQRRKDAEVSPYINHPIALAHVLANEGGVQDVTVLCAAVLHDTIEDTETTADELRALFGDQVASVVLEVTDDKSLDKAQRKQTRIDSRAQALAAAARVGNVYVNRNMIGAVVGVQPFGGEGLSGTGPKAGGPHYLLRFCDEQTLTINTTAAGGNVALFV